MILIKFPILKFYGAAFFLLFAQLKVSKNESIIIFLLIISLFIYCKSNSVENKILTATKSYFPELLGAKNIYSSPSYFFPSILCSEPDLNTIYDI